MLAGDFNEEIESDEIQTFMMLNRLIDTFCYVNKEDEENIEKT